MSKQRIVFAALVLSLSILLASGAYAAIGVYKVVTPASVPANISYMLNQDANDTTGGWSVKIEIVPAAGGPAVRTYTYLYPDPNCTKGMHSNIITWNGKKDDGTAAPWGQYKAVVSAKALPITGTDLQPLFQSAGSYYSVAVNKDRSSSSYGRIYATKKQTGVTIIEPDGTVVGTEAGGRAWTGLSEPWGLALDADGNVWVESRSNTFVACYTPDMKTKIAGDIDTNDYSRGFDVYGRFDSVCGLVTNATTGSDANASVGKLMSFKTPLPATTTLWTNGDVGTPQYLAYQQPKLIEEGGVVKALVPGRQGITGTKPSAAYDGKGGLAKYSFNWSTGVATEEWRNINLTVPMAVDITPDGTKLLISRNITTAGEQFWMIDYANAATATGPSTKYGFNTASATDRAQFFRFDSRGNVAVTYGATNSEAFQTYVGLFALPDNGSSDAFTTGEFSWNGDESPVYISGTATPNEIPKNGTTPSTITVIGEDSGNNGGNDIAQCIFYCPALGYGTTGDPKTGRVMTLGPRTGIRNTYTTTITVGASVPAGDYVADVYLYDVHDADGVVPGHGQINITVFGGLIKGVVTNGETNEPVANITVKATLGSYTKSVLTNAAGEYALNVDPGTGYIVTLPTLADIDVTFPAEYNLKSDWPANAGASDWPKSVDIANSQTVTGVSGKVWPLAVRQVVQGLYPTPTETDPNKKTWSYRVGNREVSVIGTVLRVAADAANNVKGYNGAYWITDTRSSSTQCAVKIHVRSGHTEELAFKEGDKIVVTGLYDKGYGYDAGGVTPYNTPVLKSSNNALPAARALTWGSSFMNLIGGYYNIPGATVKRIDAALQRFWIELPWSTEDQGLREMAIDLNTVASTGTFMPKVGDKVKITGILEEIGPTLGTRWDYRAVRPGKPSDLKLALIQTSKWSDLQGAGDGDIIEFANETAPVYTSWIDWTVFGTRYYVEDAARTFGIKVDGGTNYPSEYLGKPFSTIKGTMAKDTNGQLVLKLTEAVAASVDAVIIKPYAVSNRHAGGAVGSSNSVTAGIGPSNVGLLVRLYGVVTNVAGDVMYVSDSGYCVNDTAGAFAGIKVKGLMMAGLTPVQGHVVGVSGVMSLEKLADGKTIPVLIVYQASDLTDYSGL